MKPSMLRAVALGGLLGFAFSCINFSSDLEQYCLERRCSADAQCCAGYVCAQGQCAKSPSSGDGGAADGGCATSCTGATPICDVRAHSCVVCTSDSCGPGRVCDSNVGCVGCSSNADCTGATPVCHPTRNSCVGCVENGDCTLPKTCNRAAGLCEEGGEMVPYDAGVPYALNILPAAGPEAIGRCSGQWRVETVDAFDASVPFYGPVTLNSNVGDTQFYTVAGCPQVSRIMDGQLALAPASGRGSFFFVQPSVQSPLELYASYGSLRTGSASVNIAQEVTALDVRPTQLYLTLQKCSDMPLSIQLLNGGSGSSYSYDTELTYSASGSVMLYADSNCADPRPSPVSIPRGTGSVQFYVVAVMPSSQLYLNTPGVGAAVPLSVRIPPDSVTLNASGVSSYIPKNSCVQSDVTLRGSGQTVYAVNPVPVKLTANGGLQLYTSSNCSGGGGSSVDVTIPSTASAVSYSFRQPYAGANTATIVADASAAGLSGDNRTLNFFGSPPDGGSCVGVGGQCDMALPNCCPGNDCMPRSGFGDLCCVQTGKSCSNNGDCCSESCAGTICQ